MIWRLIDEPLYVKIYSSLLDLLKLLVNKAERFLILFWVFWVFGESCWQLEDVKQISPHCLRNFKGEDVVFGLHEEKKSPEASVSQWFQWKVDFGILSSNGDGSTFRFVDELKPGFRLENIRLVDMQSFSRKRAYEDPRMSAKSVNLRVEKPSKHRVRQVYSDDCLPCNSSWAQGLSSECFLPWSLPNGFQPVFQNNLWTSQTLERSIPLSEAFQFRLVFDHQRLHCRYFCFEFRVEIFSRFYIVFKV